MSGSALDDLLRGLVGAATGEDGEAAEEAAPPRLREVIRPLDRGAERLLAGICVAVALEQVETL